MVPKVRCVLLYKGVDFVAYDVDLMSEENYEPEYVAMRNLGRDNRAGGEHANQIIL